MKVIIDNHLISYVSRIFSIKPLIRCNVEELENSTKLTWGSHSSDHKVISLLMTNNIMISDLNKLTTGQINQLIIQRYNQSSIKCN